MGVDSVTGVERLFNLVTHAHPGMGLRDLEPLVGAVVRTASPTEDALTMKEALRRFVADQDWPAARRAGYMLDLLCYFGPHQELWQHVLYPWLDRMADELPVDGDLLPFYPGDSRDNPLDSLARRWGLSSGVLYDRLNRLLRPPYVC
ncbi:hypothetical protein [Acidithiobacillus sp.]